MSSRNIVGMRRHPRHYLRYRPWQHSAQCLNAVSNIENSNDGFKVNIDVQQFRPAEVSVKMVDDYVIVKGKHEEREDEHGFVSRQFVRRYKLPRNVETDTLISELSSDGVLTISASKKERPPDNSNENVKIIQVRERSAHDRSIWGY